MTVTDIRTLMSDGVGDWALQPTGLEPDDGLETAVILSLFTDRRAEPTDDAPGGDRRGWWGDDYADVPGDRIGSRLWLLAREKQTGAALLRARSYAIEALTWMIDDGVASRIDVEATAPRAGRLVLAITIQRPGEDPRTFRFERAWQSTFTAST